MSQKEFQRVKVIENAAGEVERTLLQLNERRIQRLKRRYQPDSIDWGQHGKPTPRIYTSSAAPL